MFASFHFLLCFLTLAYYTVNAETCSPSKIALCLTDFRNYTELIGNLAFDKQQLTAVCSAFTKAKTCYHEFIQDCDEADEMFIRAIALTYDYLCGDGFEIQVKNRDCYKDSQVVAASAICQNSFNANITDGYCSVIDEYYDCLSLAFEIYCDETVAKHQVKMTKLSLQPFLEDINCPISGGASKLRTATGFCLILTAAVHWLLF